MRRRNTLFSAWLLVATAFLPATARQGPDAAKAVPLQLFFEGARLITGDGNAPIENSAFLVENAGSPVSDERASCRRRR